MKNTVHQREISRVLGYRFKNNRLLGNANAKNFNKQDFEEDINYFKNRILSSYSNNYLYELKQIDASISLVLNKIT